MRLKYFIATILFFEFTFLNAQVTINEFSATNIRDKEDNYQKGEDWIELYNNGTSAKDISGWYLSDKLAKPTKWQIPANTIIPSKGFLTIWASGRNEVSNNVMHTNFRFTQTSNDEYAVLADNNGNVVESYKVPIALLSHTIGKKKDGGNEWAIFKGGSFGKSNNTQKPFSAFASPPSIDKLAGAYTTEVIVNIGDNSGYTSRYTLDGSEPTIESEIVTGPIAIYNTIVLKVKNYSSDTNNILPSKVVYSTYFIDEPVSTLPMISVASELAEDLANGDRELKPIASFEYFSKDGKLVATSYGELDSHGQDSWVNPQRSIDWISRDECGYNSGIPTKLFNYSDRADFQRIILRASGDDNYPANMDSDHKGATHVRDEYVHTLVQSGDMKMDVRSVERVLVYINGKYWGVYAIREKPDDTDYTEYTYKQDKFNTQFLKTWGRSWAEYGGQKAFDDWGVLRNFILNNDMSNADNYKKVLEDYNVTSLMDYMIANLSVVSSDWLNYNTGWWRGINEKGDHKKWGYVMWDNDATFDYYINYSGVPNIAPDAKACDLEEISQYMDEFFPKDTMVIEYEADSIFIDGMWVYYPADTFTITPDPGKHEKIFLKLLAENADFRNQYYARYADMISTTFSCDNMLTKLDSLIAIIEPEMPRHIARWGGTTTEWKKNVKRLRTFIEKRCKLIDDGMIDCYDELSGPYNVTLISDPPNAGTIKFNTLTHAALPWKGSYFGGMPNSIEVKENTTAKFKKWVSIHGTTSFDKASSKTTIANLTAADTLIAVFENGLTASNDIAIDKLQITPNPASNYIKIDLPNKNETYNYTIIDNLGKTVSNGQLNQTTMNVEFLNSGVYTIRLINRDLENFVGRFIVVR